MATRNLLVRAGFDATGMRSGTRQATTLLNNFGSNANRYMTRIGSSVRGLSKLVATALTVKFGRDCLELGSNLSEVQNVVDTTFGNMSQEINNFASTAIDQFGLSETSAKKYSSTIGAMAKSFGFTTAEAVKMGKEITGRTADIASFYNLSNDESYTKMKSIFTGETESLKELGVVMTQNALDQYALQNGYGKTTKKMTEQEKVALRMAFVMEKTKLAAGDFSKTSGGWANQTRILAEQFNALKASIGQGLIAVFTPVIKTLNVLITKLRVVAESFRSFTEMVFGKQAISAGAGIAAIADNTGDIATGASNASDNIDDMGDAAKSAGEKAKAALMGFDEINKLGDSDGGSASSGLDLGDMGTDMASVDFGKAETGATKLDGVFNKLIEDAKRLKGLFAEGFKLGLGEDFNTKLSNIKTSLDGIKKSLNDIVKDEKVTSSFDNLVNSVATNSGKVAGSIASVGATIAQNLVGGIDKSLDQNKDYIKRRVVGIMDATAETSELVGDYSAAWADIFSVFGDENGQQVTANALAIATNVSLGVTDVFSKLGRDVPRIFMQPLIDNKDDIKTAVDNTLAHLASVTGTLNEGIKTSYDNLVTTYEAKVAPMLQSFADGISKIVDTAVDSYNEHMAPTLNRLADQFDELWQDSIQPCINQAIELAGKLTEAIKLVWETAIQPIYEFITKTVVPIVSAGIENIINLIMGIVGVVANVIKDVMTTIGGLIDFITGVFSGDWDKAWGGISDIVKGAGQLIYDTTVGPLMDISTYLSDKFKGAWTETLDAIKLVWKVFPEWVSQNVTDPIKTRFGSAWDDIKTRALNAFNGIKNGVKTAINGMISHINGLFKKINTIGIDIPKELGGGRIGFDIPEIPKLARGGIVSSPTLAMVGEAGKEAIVPLENTGFVTTLANAVASAVANSMPSQTYESNGNQRIVIQIGDSTIGDIAISEINRRSRQQGKFILNRV